VAIADGKIETVGERDAVCALHPTDSGWQRTDFANTVICPGFINLHTHLDYSHSRYVDTESGLFDWIYKLVASTGHWQHTKEKNDFLDSARYGARQIAQSGTTFVVDSAYRGASAEAIAEVGIRGIIGLELFGIDSPETSWHLWKERFARLVEHASPALTEALADKRVVLTVAPHAPYTVCPALWKTAVDWADSAELPVLAHLAESQEELDWLAGDSPALNSFLSKMITRSHEEIEFACARIPNISQGLTPVRFLERNEMIARQMVAAHCVHVDEDGLGVLKARNVAIAHCPRSNARLRNGRAPFEKWLAQGIKFGLGTDSFASSDSLNLLQEALFALNLHRASCPELQFSAADALKLITLDAAKALGLEAVLGSLENGKAADMAVFECADDLERLPPGDPHNLLLRGQPNLVALFVEGKQLDLGSRASDGHSVVCAQ
jgi:aminodeoxyfutalosine deaminase